MPEWLGPLLKLIGAVAFFYIFVEGIGGGWSWVWPFLGGIAIGIIAMSAIKDGSAPANRWAAKQWPGLAAIASKVYQRKMEGRLFWSIGVIAAVYFVVEPFGVVSWFWFWPFVIGALITVFVMRDLASQRENEERYAQEWEHEAEMKRVKAEMKSVKRRTKRQSRTS